MYANSEPPAVFQELIDNATLNDLGKKEIPFDDHIIDEDLFEEILKKYEKQFKSYYRKGFRQEVYLGCSPKFIRKQDSV